MLTKLWNRYEPANKLQMRLPSLIHRTRLAFTLIELLVVITVISLLLAFSAPALFNGLQASRLSGAGERMISTLSEAQQTAFSQNCVIEVQFYYFDGLLGAGPAFRSYRIFKVTNPNSSEGNTKENVSSVGSIVNLPDGVIISADTGLSPALAGSTIADDKKNAGVENAQYSAIRFLPDGTCRKVTGGGGNTMATLDFLNLPQSFFTMLEDDGHTYSATMLPKNFYTIQTDPFTGKSRSYRPGF
jgi:uncharacterized protein (TIGR02596 family)